MRVLTVAGMGLLAGATLGMGPAQAAADTGQANTSASASQHRNHWGNDEVVGFYRNVWACERAGRIGERFGAWDDYDCERVRGSFRRGAWALVVDDNDWDNRWDNRWRPGHWPANWTNRPDWPGQHNGGPHNGPGRPGNDGPGRPGNDGPGRPGNDGPGRPGNDGPGRPGNDGPGRPGSDGPGRPVPGTTAAVR
jgi:hypothetical protein